MTERVELSDIPRGNTAPGVGRLVVQHLISSLEQKQDVRVLDIPCGNGEFLDSLKAMMPNVETTGADLNVPDRPFDHAFYQVDASRGFTLDSHKKFDAITCISGVMEFDNTLSFFEQIRTLIEPDGEFLVTNDNLLTIRDRLLYLLFGRFRQFKHSMRSGVPTWKMIPLQNLIRILADAGFDVTQIAYVPPKLTEWIWLPAAIPIYIAQYLYMRFAMMGVDEPTIRKMFPFISLLSRHYVLICLPRN